MLIWNILTCVFKYMCKLQSSPYCQGVHLLTWLTAGLSSSFESPVVLNFTLKKKKCYFVSELCQQKGNFIHNTKGLTSILSCNRCYGLGPLMTSLGCRETNA